MVTRVNQRTTGIFSRVPEPIALLRPEISCLIGDAQIHISEFIIAKVKGLIPAFIGHPEISDAMFLKLPHNLSYPQKILADRRSDQKHLFITSEPEHIIVVEVRRLESGKTEINTIYPIGDKEKRRLEKFQITFSHSGGTPTPSCMPRL
jgi:hypothetical protein